MNNPRQRIKIVVDSAADLPGEWVSRLGIGVVPAYVNFGTQSYADDGVALPRHDFYRLLADAKTLPTTSAPPAAVAEQVIGDQLKNAEQVVSFTVASQFSSMYNSIRVAAEHVDKQRVTVVDSGSVSMGEGWQALAAAEAAAQGASFDEVLAAARSTRERTKLYAVIDTLEYLRRGGRVSWALANVGALLQIKPMLEVHEGAVETIGRVRTMSKAVQAIIDLTRQQAPLERLAVMHSNYRAGAEQLLEQLRDIAPEPNVMIGDVTTAIGTHIGPGCVGVITVRKV